MKMIALVAVFLGLCTMVPIRWGKCATPTLQSPFSASTYTGVGYVARRVKNVPWDTKDCGQIKVSAPDGNGKQTFFVGQYDIAKSKSSSTSGTLSFTTSTSAIGTLSGSSFLPSGDFRVVTNTASPPSSVLYSCVPYLFFFKKEFMWIFVQNKADAGANANPLLSAALLKVNTFSSGDFITPLQTSDCKYLN